MTADNLSGVVRIKSNRVYEGVVLQIQDLIAQGKLRPGEKLPPERELAERFGIGRNSIREAIRQLELLGLVEARQGEGTFITEATIDTIAAPFLSILAQSQQLRAEVLDFRKILEPRIAALAAQRATPENIARIEELAVAFDECVYSEAIPIAQSIELDTQFHHAIAEATQNGLIVRVMSAVIGLLQEFRLQLLESAYHDPALAHRSITEAIRMRDSQRAHEAMENHLAILGEFLPFDQE